MARLNDRTIKALRASELVPLATASSRGIPNVIPIKFVIVESQEVLWLVDNFLNKTLDNIQCNPHAAIYVYSSEDNLCVQIKGTIEIQTSGPDFERMRDIVHATRPDLPAKSLVVMRITDQFQCMPGPDAGIRIEP